MSSSEESTHVVVVEFRVDADKGTRRVDIITAVRKRAKALKLHELAGCRIRPGTVRISFQDEEDNRAAERGW